MPKIICLEAIDGAGKSSQVDFLIDYLNKSGKSVKHIHFPRYDTPVGGLIKKWLQGEFDLHQFAIQMLYETDRYDAIGELTDDNVDYIVLDRYIYSALAFGWAQGASMEWLASLQTKLPKPDYTIILTIDPKVAMERVADHDRNEIDFALLNMANTAYSSYVQGFMSEKHTTLDVTRMTIEEVRERILSDLQEHEIIP